MLREANRFCLRLWKDDSGVALAISVIVFLTLFCMACSVYSVGETIRQRIELQNACDAATYSAAVVQADSISRIAALNRAMVWTYAQLVKRDMDLIVDAWLWRSYISWFIDKTIAETINRVGMCAKGHPYWGAGGIGCWECIHLNRKYWVEADTVFDAITNFLPLKILNLLMIEHHKKNIEAINLAIDDIIAKMPEHIETAVEEVLKANIADTFNDTLTPAGSADVMYFLKQPDPAEPLFFVWEQEAEFFVLADIKPHKDYLGAGFGEWFVQVPGSGGMLHEYKEADPYLVADWWTWSFFGVRIWGVCFPIKIMDQDKDENEVWASESYKESYYKTVLARARGLNMNFFGKDGTIVVGLARRMNNPFQFVSPGMAGADRSMYNAFTLNDDSRFMWTAAAARAGYWLPGRSVLPGDYKTTYWHDEGDVTGIWHWNIRSSDWDGILLPLRRAWHTGENGEWKGGPPATAILSEVQGGPWTALYGGGGAVGTQNAPELMGGGGAFNVGGAENWILH